MLMALTRAPSPALERCELTWLERAPIDVERAQAEHHAYEQCLAALGCTVRRLDADPALGDAVFIEDCAVVLDEVALITRPGAESRRAETPGVEQALRAYRPIRRIEPPGTLDGGDVLRLGRRIFIGLSRRSNAAALEQCRALLQPFGYQVAPVAVGGCLHLKSAVSVIGDDVLLVNPGWIDAAVFRAAEVVEIDPLEPHAANALRIAQAVVHPMAFPRTRRRMEQRGIRVVSVAAGELAKAEGGVTCCSLVFPDA
jgi:dimethylargininase